ncbi:hypothetical protein RIR_jg40384.t1 [Rhizophagus irregularis DAOM 181602=DAOM 197198]|nr:hypothetical protein RIR_jg40384.t1 [Rhizophagus irregularis DAOM 181602=DAOM 197198]
MNVSTNILFYFLGPERRRYRFGIRHFEGSAGQLLGDGTRYFEGSSGELRNGKPRMVQVFRPCEIQNDGSSVRLGVSKRYSLDIGFRNVTNVSLFIFVGSLRLLYRTGMLRPKRGICRLRRSGTLRSKWLPDLEESGYRTPRNLEEPGKITGLLGIWENLDLVGTPDKITNWTLDERERNNISLTILPSQNQPNPPQSNIHLLLNSFGISRQ